jgi:hypothetical protein
VSRPVESEVPSQPHEWDALREFPTVWGDSPGGVHESVLRSYQVLREVTAMLERGDSVETVLLLIRFADGGYA